MHRHTFKDLQESYNYIYVLRKTYYLTEGKTEDKASRLANMDAVKNNWKVFLKNKELSKEH